MKTSMLLFPLGLALCLAMPLQAQVHYHNNDSPWGHRADSGPDADVPGWYYNLGITGLRAQLVADQPKALLIKYVFPNSNDRRYGDLMNWTYMSAAIVLCASSVVAFIFTIPRHGLMITGKDAKTSKP